MNSALLQHVAASSQRSEPLAPFRIGDSVDVHTRIVEGDKERIQVLNGTVIAIHRGQLPTDSTFTVRRIVDGEGFERIFPLHSPRIAKVEVTRQGRVRRAKLYYLRDRVGKGTKVQEKLVKKA